LFLIVTIPVEEVAHVTELLPEGSVAVVRILWVLGEELVDCVSGSLLSCLGARCRRFVFGGIMLL
jgi:hypothetical protein